MDSKNIQTAPPSAVEVCGLVISDHFVANMKREILLVAEEKDEMTFNGTNGGEASTPKQFRVKLHAEDYKGVSMWMTIKKARQLICTGVRINVQGFLEDNKVSAYLSTSTDRSNKCDQVSQDNQISINTRANAIKVIHATSIQVVCAPPTNTYLSTLLSFSLENLHRLFPGPMRNPSSDAHSCPRVLPPGVLKACCAASITPAHVENVAGYCRGEVQAGRASKLWKAPLIQELVQELKDYQEAHGMLTIYCEDSRKHGQLPRVSKRTSKSLDRLERRWANQERDGDIGDFVFDLPTHSYRTERKVNKKGSSFLSTGTRLSSTISQDQEPHATMKTIIEHDQNLPDQQDERRRLYIDRRKRPQVRCMLQFIDQLLSKQTYGSSSSEKNDRCLQLMEIGGGRGYLANEVSAFYKPHQPTDPATSIVRSSCHVHVTVVDNNERSLNAGKVQAEQAGLLDRMSFVLCDLGDEDQVSKVLGDKATAPLDLVFGLHCCGGLAEAAVEFALQKQASFCISTCCFRSIPQLASLTRTAVEVWAEQEAIENAGSDGTQEENKNELQRQLVQTKRQEMNEDIARVAALAVNVGARGLHRGVRVCNAMRLFSAQVRFASVCHDKTLKVWQESFPVEYSVQNRVLMGLVQPKRRDD